MELLYKKLQSRRIVSVAVLIAALALPCFGSIAVDPGSQPMFWHVLGASTMLAVLNWQKVANLMQEHAGLRSVRSTGFAFATAYALLAGSFSLSFFGGHPTPRFNDIFL